MRLLLDTHALLWSLGDPGKLSMHARKAIEERENVCLLSVGSLWEIAIKISLGKLQMDIPIEAIPAELDRLGVVLLGIDVAHLVVLSKLPFHHRDPFDRLLICQSLVDDLHVVSADAVFDRYGVNRIW